jgi:hypothetical protein
MLNQRLLPATAVPAATLAGNLAFPAISLASNRLGLLFQPRICPTGVDEAARIARIRLILRKSPNRDKIDDLRCAYATHSTGGVVAD